jgi:hypothetical protein
MVEMFGLMTSTMLWQESRAVVYTGGMDCTLKGTSLSSRKSTACGRLVRKFQYPRLESAARFLLYFEQETSARKKT